MWVSLTVLSDLYMHLCIQGSSKVECIDSPEMTSQVGKHGGVTGYWKSAQPMTEFENCPVTPHLFVLMPSLHLCPWQAKLSLTVDRWIVQINGWKRRVMEGQA